MKTLAFFLAIILSLSLTPAIVLNSVDADILTPGQEGTIKVEIENNFNKDAEDVTISLNYKNTPFIPIGASEQSEEKIEEDEDEEFIFRLKADYDIKPMNYEIPYTITYKIDNEEKTREGTIGIQVKADTILTFSVIAETAIINRQSQVSLKIINKGFSDARFVSIRVLEEGYTVLSDDEEYIGEVESDDFETANFDVLFTNQKAEFTAIIEYLDFENKKVIEHVSVPLTVYSVEEATALGLISPNKSAQYFTIAITFILAYILWRTIKKSRRMKRSLKKE